MKKTIFCIIMLCILSLVAGCTIEDGKLYLFKTSEKTESIDSDCNCKAWVNWSEDEEGTLELPLSPERRIQFINRCGENYKMGIDADGYIVINCESVDEDSDDSDEPKNMIENGPFAAVAHVDGLDAEEPLDEPGFAKEDGTPGSENGDNNAGNRVRGNVTMNNPEVSGSLDKRIIQKIVRQHYGELRACYEKELSKVKGLNGRIVVIWLVSPQGTVTSALVKETTLKNKNVESCVTNSIKFWRFPAPRGGGIAKVEYPFVFEMGNK